MIFIEKHKADIGRTKHWFNTKGFAVVEYNNFVADVDLYRETIDLHSSINPSIVVDSKIILKRDIYSSITTKLILDSVIDT